MEAPDPLEVIFSEVRVEFVELLANSARFREIHEDYRLLLKDFGRLSAAPEQGDKAALYDIKAALSGLVEDAREALQSVRRQGTG